MKVRYRYDNNIFDSSWELAYYIYLTTNEIDFTYKPAPLRYFDNGQQHLYYPDFLVDNKYVESKANTSVNEHGKLKLYPRQASTEAALTSLAAKQRCLEDNGVRILTKKEEELRMAFAFIRKNYGSTYLQQFREERRNG